MKWLAPLGGDSANVESDSGKLAQAIMAKTFKAITTLTK